MFFMVFLTCLISCLVSQKLVALFLAFQPSQKLDALFPTFPKTCFVCVLPKNLLPFDPFVIVILSSKHLLWSSSKTCSYDLKKLASIIYSHLHPCYSKISLCIHSSKFRLFMFFYKWLLFSLLLPSYLSFLFSWLLLLHSCRKFMFSYNSWLLHSYYNTSPTQHPNFCFCFNVPLLWCCIAKIQFVGKRLLS